MVEFETVESIPAKKLEFRRSPETNACIQYMASLPVGKVLRIACSEMVASDEGKAGLRKKYHAGAKSASKMLGGKWTVAMRGYDVYVQRLEGGV